MPAKPVRKLYKPSLLLAILIVISASAYLTTHALASSEAPNPARTPATRAALECATPTSCRTALRKAYEAIAWNKKQRLELARQMVGKLTDWTCIHQHEGAWNDTRDPYWGGLQMDRSFMRSYGRDMLAKYRGRGYAGLGFADVWTPREQIIVAQRAYAQGRGYAPWPNTSRICGLR